MAIIEYPSLKDLLTGIATALRTKLSTTDELNAQDFSTQIRNMSGSLPKATLLWQDETSPKTTGTMALDGIDLTEYDYICIVLRDKVDSIDGKFFVDAKTLGDGTTPFAVLGNSYPSYTYKTWIRSFYLDTEGIRYTLDYISADGSKGTGLYSLPIALYGIKGSIIT